LTPYIIKDPTDLRKIFDRKLRERREFMERYSAFRDERDYDAEVDYRRKRGLLEEVNRSAIEAETEAMELRNAEATLGRDITGEVVIDPAHLPPVTPPPPPGPRSGPTPAPA